MKKFIKQLTTIGGRIMIPNVPREQLKALQKELTKHGFSNVRTILHTSELLELRYKDSCIALIDTCVNTSNVNSCFMSVVYEGMPIELLKKGEVIRIGNTKRVYTLEGYCRYNKAYEVGANDDISYSRYLKKGKLVKTDFDY